MNPLARTMYAALQKTRIYSIPTRGPILSYGIYKGDSLKLSSGRTLLTVESYFIVVFMVNLESLCK